MTSPVRPTTAKRRKTYAELSADIDDFLASAQEGIGSAPPPKPPRPVGDELLTGLRIDKNRPNDRDPELPKTPPHTLRDEVRDAGTAIREGLPATAQRMAAGALRQISSLATLAANGESGDVAERSKPRALKVADGLERKQRERMAKIPATTGGIVGSMLAGGAPYALTGPLGGAAMAAADARGGEEGSGLAGASSLLRMAAERDGRDSNPGMVQSLASGTANQIDALRKRGGFVADAAEGLWDYTAGKLIGKVGGAVADNIKRTGRASTIDALGGEGLLRGPRAASPATPAPSLGPVRASAMEPVANPAEPDLDAWRETTFGGAMFNDPLREATGELDEATAGVQQARSARQQRIDAMRARGREALADRALQAEQREVAALQTQIPPLPRTTPTSAEVDTAARSQEAWARREYGQQDRLNTAVDTGTDDEILSELNRLVKRDGGTPLADIRSKLDPQQATPQLDEVGQQLDEAGRETLDAQNAPEVVNPNVRAAKAKLDEALDSGDDRKVQRALRDLAKLQDQGLYAAAPAGLALSQDENGEGMDGGDASLLALAGVLATRKGRKTAKALGEIAWENGKRVIRSLPDITAGEYQVAREVARARSQELLLDTPRFNAFGGKSLDDEIDELRARGETERADNMEKSFGQTVVRIPVFHATLADFTVPDPSKARADGFAGPTMYLTTNPSDAGVNYAKSDIYGDDGTIDYNKLDFDLRRKNKTGFGPDLNIRFDEEFDEAWSQKLAELRYSGEIKNMSTKQIDALRNDMAAAAARKVAHSDLPAGNIMPMYADVRKPFVTNGPNITLYDMDNWGAKEEQAFRRAAREAGAEPELIRESLADIRATMEGGESLSHYYFANLTANLTAGFDFAKGADILQRFVKKLGYDAFVTDAAEQFPAMKLTPGTMHVQVFDPNSQVKSATGNTGAFDMNNPDIRYSAAGAAGAGAAASDDDGEHDSFLQAAAAAALVAGGAKWAQRYARPENVTKRATQWVRKNAPKGVPAVQQLAKAYLTTANIEAENLPRVRQVDPIFAKRVADWYENTPSDPTNPEVVAAYRAFADETRQQFEFLQQQGITFEFIDDNPYNSSAEMLRDVAENKRLRVYKTTDEQAHQLLSNEENDMFRAVHDFFGHAKEGHQFGPKGEENAYRVHSAMFSPQARRVMAAETRGQNSWVNFSEKAQANRTKPGSVYAEQKSLLMPEEFMREYPDAAPVSAVTNVEFKSEAQPGFTNAEFKEMTGIERRLGRSAFISKVVEPIIRSENLPASVAKGLGSWFAEGDTAITEAARVELAKLPKYIIERALARVSSAAKQAGYFFAVPNPNGESVAVTLDFGKSLSEEQYKQVVEALSREDGGTTFEGTTMVRLTPGRMQTVLKKGMDETAATALVEQARALFPNLNVTGDVGRVDAILRGGDTLDEALAQYAERIGVLSTGERRVQQEAARNYERIAGRASRTRSTLGNVESFLEGVRTAGERGVGQVARATTGAARPAAIGAALALTPSEAEGQGTGVGEAAAGVGGYLAAALAGGTAGVAAVRGARRLAKGRLGQAVRTLAPKDAMTGSGATAPYTSNLRQIQRAALKNPIREVSEVVPEEWFRLDKVSPDADKARIAEAVERLVVSEGLGVQGFAKDGTPKVNKPVITWDTYRADMKAKGMDAEDLITTAKRRGLQPAEMFGVQALIGENSVAIAALDKAIRDPGTPKEEKARLATIMKGYQDQMDRLVVTRMTESSGYGRNLNSLKATAAQTLDPGVWYTRARRMLDDELSTQDIVAIDGFIRAEDRVGLAKYVADMKRTSAGDLFTALVKGGMLSGLKTHITNFASNVGQAAAEITKDAPASVADRVLTGLVNYLDADKAGARRTKDFNLSATLKASAEGARKGTADAKKILRGEPVASPFSKWDNNGEVTFRSGNPKVDLLVTTFLNLPFRALAASDRIFKESAISRSIAEQQRVLGTQAVTEDMALNAITDAAYATFQQETIIGEGLSALKQGAVRKAKEGGAVSGFIAQAALETTFPFVKTPAAILSTASEYAMGALATPFDLWNLQEAARKGLSDPAQRAIVEKLQKRTAERLGRQTVGAAAIMTGWVLAANGMLSLPIPINDKAKRETEELYGNAPGGSINTGNENPVSVDRLSPLGNLLVAGAALFEQTQDPNSGLAADIATATFGMGRAMLDNAMMSGVRDLQRATSDNDGAVGNYFKNRATALVPYGGLLRSVERVVDPAIRDAQTTGEKLRSMVPFASSSVPVKLDALGNPMTGLSRGKALLNEFIPGNMGIDRSKSNAQAKLLREVGATLGRPDFDRDKETRDEYRDRAGVLGVATRKELDRLQRLPRWNQMSDDEKRDKIKTRVSTVRSRATKEYRRGLTVPASGLRPNVAGGGGGSSY